MHMVNRECLFMACMMFVALGCSAEPGDQDGAGGSDAPARCSDRAWSTYSTAPIAAEGTAPPFTGREALAGRLVDTDEARELRWLTVGTAPGWGCETPAVIAVGVLPVLPEGDPWGLLEELAPSTATDMGDGFTLLGFELPEAVMVPAGLGPWVVAGIEGAECGVKAQLDLSAPRGMHWTEAGGWQEVDAQLVMGAGGCEIECPVDGDDDPCVRYVVQEGACVAVPVC